MASQEEKRKRGIAVQLLIKTLDTLRTKVDVLAEPFVEAKNVMNEFYGTIVPILRDYGQLQIDVENLREEIQLWKKKAEEAEKKLGNLLRASQNRPLLNKKEVSKRH